MWNFTGRAVVIPDIADIEELMKCPTTATMSQTDVTSIISDDLFLGKNYFQMWIIINCNCFNFEVLFEGAEEELLKH